MMVDFRFAEALSERARRIGIALTPEELSQLKSYWDLLIRWNDKINLTALPLRSSPEDALDRLILEPLAASPLVSTDSIVWFDLGSGGGSPAIPLKILRPAASLTMVESRSRKAAFLIEAARFIGLTSVDVRHERIEEQARSESDPARESNDLVTIRAVFPDEGVARAITRLLRPQGQLMLFGTAQDEPRLLRGLQFIKQERLASVPASAVQLFRRA
jgi:16S rRNA (guanine527-N7)-methyltransferase